MPKHHFYSLNISVQRQIIVKHYHLFRTNALSLQQEVLCLHSTRVADADLCTNTFVHCIAAQFTSEQTVTLTNGGDFFYNY